ncbi:MAG: ABC transporter permease [Bacteroidales bacterium]|nr:ABC transporter permease [Bacteroidales bacterium]
MPEKWDIVIKPKNGIFELNLKELIQYKDLYMLFVKRDIITQYKQTILGPLWFFIQPALTTIMFMVVFGGIAGIPTDGIPQPLFYLIGISLWNYFSGCLTATSTVFVTNQSIFGKVYFPRLISPLSTITSNLVKLGIQFLMFIAVYIYYIIIGVNVSPNIYLLLTPFLILMLAAQSLGFGIIISSLTTKYRDLTILFTFVVQLWMYATPVIYPMSIMSPQKQFIMSLNPITPIFEAFKYATLGIGTFTIGQLLYSLVFTVVLLLIGIITFNRVQRSFMDTV